MKYPRPTIPLKPTLCWPTFTGYHNPTVSSILDNKFVLKVTSGRVAIALALKDGGISSNHKVLVPAYHCTSMIEPVVWTGASPVFYRIHNDTSVDLNDIENKIDSTTKAIIVTHYFGFPQNMNLIRSFCDRYGLTLIEDCAHSFFGVFNSQAIGSVGDYAIASAMKFFPIYDGGILASSKNNVSTINLKPAGWRFHIKTTLNNMEYSFEYRRFPLLRIVLKLPFYIKDLFWKKIKTRKESSEQSLGPGASDGAYEFDPKWLYTPTSFSSRLILSTSSKAHVTGLRQRNYNILHNALSDLKGCIPLFRELPNDVIPYIYPLLVDYPEKVFPILKKKGVPILRFGELLWPDMDTTICDNTMVLSRKLLQFPVHQELKLLEINWMITEIVRAINSSL